MIQYRIGVLKEIDIKINKYYPNFPNLNVLKHVFNISISNAKLQHVLPLHLIFFPKT